MRRKEHWFFVFFLVSGFCSLVYEVVWLRLAIARFGVTTPMISIVLSVFMAGLGLGSRAGGRLARRVSQSAPAVPLRFYGLLELLIGAAGLLVPLGLDWGSQILRSQGKGLEWGSVSYHLASGGWVTLALLPGCVCMGATFPLAMAAIRSMPGSDSRRSFSSLYLANVLGGVLGALVPTFALIELFGFLGTLRIASALNGILAAVVLAFSFSPKASTISLLPARPTEQAVCSGRARFLWLLFATGLCSMAMEVIWIRQFAVYLGNVVYTFATILALYLFATFVGASLYRRRTGPALLSHWDRAWMGLGFAALLPLIFADPRFPGRDVANGLGSFLNGAVRAACGIGLFSGLVGFLTPMLIDRWSEGDPDRAGRAYAVNILGSMLGPLLAAFCILPWAGERAGLCVAAAPLLAIGWVSALRAPSAGSRGAGPRLLYAGGIAASLATIVFSRGFEARFPQREELRDYTAAVIATGQGMNKRLLVNGFGMTYLSPIAKMMAHLPLAMLPGPATQGLVVGFGMGTTFRSMLSWGIPTTVVDLVPSVPRMFGYYYPNGPDLLRSPLAHVVIDDARRFLERSTGQFSVIVTDPPPPIGAPASSLLYSLEFYAIVKRRLQPGGIVQIWFPGGDPATMSAIAMALRNSFPYVRAYNSIEGWGTHFLARLEPFAALDAQDLARRLPSRAAQDLIEWSPASTPAQMIGDVLSREQPFERLTSSAPSVSPLTDDRPVNEYFLLRTLRAAAGIGELHFPGAM